ncbi:hypothetical protein [Pseudomonas mandelii]|uniref:hypothetical protein n=1 Tax=Pseudomonas mandelii TaxID=75612 RepID=UPI0012B22897|nr:hypothetical protein [Pseudomonas mandelii]
MTKLIDNFSKKLFSPKSGFYIFLGLISITYGLVPLLISLVYSGSDYFLKLAGLTLVAVIALFLGYKTPLLDRQFSSKTTRISINSSVFNFFVWSFFFVFVVYTFYTAPSIPLLSALQGASADELSQERGDFFKGRTGVEAGLLYLSTIFTTVLIPYSIVLMYLKRSPFRHVFLVVAFLFCISFLQKALFLNVFLPLLVCFAVTGKLPVKALIPCAAGAISLLAFAVYLSLGAESGTNNGWRFDVLNYFSSTYVSEGSGDYFFWRVFAVPVFTATDTLLVHAEKFAGDSLLGATSLLISTVTGAERINIERYVFQHQFGSWNEIANANAVFITDAYINFSWVGVVLFSGFVGQVFRWFRLSEDVAFKSLWPVFALTLYSASLIGMLISNGFLYILVHALLLQVNWNRRPHLSREQAEWSSTK